MTLIIGIEESDRAFLVSDSGEWRGRERHIVTRPKIWRRGEWLVGCSGNIADQQIVRQRPLPTVGKGAPIEDPIEALVDWASDLQRHLNRYREMMDVVDSKREIESGMPQILTARAGSVFHIHLGEVTRPSLQGFAVVGQHGFGYGAVHGVIEASASFGRTLTAFEIAHSAMRAAYRGMDTVFGPICWLCTDGSSGRSVPPDPLEYREGYDLT